MTKTSPARPALDIVSTMLVPVGDWLTDANIVALHLAASSPTSDALRWTMAKTTLRLPTDRPRDVQLPDASSGDPVVQGGISPKPPHLMHTNGKWHLQDNRWIMQIGIKVRGMPALCAEHTASKVVAVTAPVRGLPGMTADDDALTADPAPAPFQN